MGGPQARARLSLPLTGSGLEQALSHPPRGLQKEPSLVTCIQGAGDLCLSLRCHTASLLCRRGQRWDPPSASWTLGSGGERTLNPRLCQSAGALPGAQETRGPRRRVWRQKPTGQGRAVQAEGTAHGPAAGRWACPRSGRLLDGVEGQRAASGAPGPQGCRQSGGAEGGGPDVPPRRRHHTANSGATTASSRGRS